MIGELLDHVKCPICLDGHMQISVSNTFRSYLEGFNLDNLDSLVDGIIDQYWVFVCLSCGAKQRFNFKDIERNVRKDLSQKVLTLKAKGEMDKVINVKVRHLVYCGVCNGFDSKGSCPDKIYKSCELRRMPRVI